MKKTKEKIKDVYDYVDAGDKSVIDYATEITNAGDESLFEYTQEADQSVIDYATEITNAGDQSVIEYAIAGDESVMEVVNEAIVNVTEGIKNVYDYVDEGEQILKESMDAGYQSVVDYADTCDKILEKEINNQAAQDKLHQQEIDANKVIVESGLTILKHYQEIFEQMKEESTKNKQEITELIANVENIDDQLNKEEEGLIVVALGL